MGISIQTRNDYSYLFNSMNKNSGNSLSSMNWLSDYNSIKSGSYGKLMKAYYSTAAEDSSSSSKSASKTDSTSILSKLTDHKVPATTASDEAKAFNKAAASADALQTSIKDLSSLKDDADDDKIYDSLNKYVFKPIKWITPVLLLVLTSIDFAGVVFSGDQKGMDKAKNNFLTRSVAALIIFFAPYIINLIAELVDQQSISSCLNKFGLTK